MRGDGAAAVFSGSTANRLIMRGLTWGPLLWVTGQGIPPGVPRPAPASKTRDYE
jgi:hypothetical protein